MFTQAEIDAFIHAHAVAALWSSLDDDCNPLDDIYGVDDISDSCKASMIEDCKDFIQANAQDLKEYCKLMQNEQYSGMERAGHDFWLTRNRHGAGFWDRGLGALGERLNKAAKVYGEVYIYPGDDCFIYD